MEDDKYDIGAPMDEGHPNAEPREREEEPEGPPDNGWGPQDGIPNEWLDVPYTLTPNEPPDAAKVRATANWVARQYREAAAEISVVDAELYERITELEDQIAAIRQRGRMMAAPAISRQKWLTTRFAGTLARLLQDAGTKKVRLLDATIVTKVDNQTTIRIADEAATRAFVTEHGIDGVFVPKTGENVLITPLKELWKSTKTVPPGCELVEGHEHIEVHPVGT